MSLNEAESYVEEWSIAQMLQYCQLDSKQLRERLDFDPETGKKWNDE